MYGTPVKKIRPTRKSDSDGGIVDVLNAGSDLWVDIVPHKNELQMVFRSEEDVRVGDVIAV